MAITRLLQQENFGGWHGPRSDSQAGSSVSSSFKGSSLPRRANADIANSNKEDKMRGWFIMKIGGNTGNYFFDPLALLKCQCARAG